MEQPLSFPRLTDLKRFSTSFGQYGEDYIFANITSGSQIFDILREPVRVSGVSLCLVLSGTMSMTIDDTDYTLPPDSLLNFSSSTVVKVNGVTGDDINIFVLFISSQFLHDINIDVNAINLHSMVEQGHVPVIRDLTDNERTLLSEIMQLLYHSSAINDESLYKKNIARSLIQALLYQLLLIRAERVHVAADDSERSSRRVNYVHDFMQLVQIHHVKERSLTFYADKLYITPKYLSRIIKEATGKSAASWIDDFVIAEAKNMLRFSNKNIQQVAYELNFTTQSSFGKFFKHLTGMSPSEYQKT